MAWMGREKKIAVAVRRPLDGAHTHDLQQPKLLTNQEKGMCTVKQKNIPPDSVWLCGGNQPPPPPCPLYQPKFQLPQSEGAGRGLVPLGNEETGEQTFLLPLPPQQKWGQTESRPSTPPPPNMPSHPHCRPSHGDRGPLGSGHRTTSMLGSGTRMVTQQVVLLSYTNEQVDPSTTLPPPPSLRPRREGCTEWAPSGPKKWRL